MRLLTDATEAEVIAALEAAGIFAIEILTAEAELESQVARHDEYMAYGEPDGRDAMTRSLEYGDIGKSFEVTRDAFLNEKQYSRGREHKLKRGDVIQLVGWKESTWDPPVPEFEILEVDPTDPQSEWEPDAIGTGVRGYFSPTQGGNDRTPHRDYIRPFDWRQRLRHE